MGDAKVGEMILYDMVLPPLLSNAYRMTVKTDVRLEDNAAPQPLESKQAHFDIDTPRFMLPATEVGGVSPPRNGHGSFAEVIPQIALYRRTMPWERRLESGNLIGNPTLLPGDPDPPNAPPPWMALLLFEEGEYTLLQNVRVRDVVPGDVFARLGKPNAVCDAIETSATKLKSIIPSKEELQLLAHVREVNFDDRELSAGDSDGFFAVIMSNRLPNPNTKCRACLVSLEERADIVPRDPPQTAAPPTGDVFQPIEPEREVIVIGTRERDDRFVNVDNAIPTRPDRGVIGGIGIDPGLFLENNVRLVLLYSWQFATIGPGNFQDLMQRLDVGMTGKVEEAGHPRMTDTAHLPLDVQNRVGEQEIAWYRSPFVPFQLTRDTLGPYHSADQARRVTPETGAEDISYAAAFEVGRLLAAADPRLAQELMRWRRESYKQSSRIDSLNLVQETLQLGESLDPRTAIGPVVATAAIEKIADAPGPISDPFGLRPLTNVIGFDPQAVERAFNLSSTDEAIAILGGDAGALGAIVKAPPTTVRDDTTIDRVAEDRGALNHLLQLRDRIFDNTKTKLGG